MKKYLIIFILLFILINLNALQLTRYYFKNYGIIDRSVFVFDQRPVYSLEELSDQILINVDNCTLAPDINDQVLSNNPVLSSYAFSNLQTDIRITISLNRAVDETREYKVEEFLLSSQGYKLVVDVFKYAEPVSKAEINAFIDFYRKVELKKQASVYEQLLAGWKPPSRENEKLEEEEKPSEVETEVSETDIPVSDDQKEQKTPTLKLLEQIQQLYHKTPLIYIILAAALIIIFIIIIMIIISSKKRPVASDVFQNKVKLGSKNFRVKVIKILREAGWEDNMIAEELGISQEEVKNIPK